jgi:phosphoserine aminotransferase
MSSDFLSRPIEVAKYGLIYAGAQKNAGPAGVTIVIMRKDLLERVPEGMPAMLDYRLMTEKNSLYNTPPVFSIYIVGLVLGWLIESGGLEGIAQVNERKASTIYGAIDQSGGFYRGFVVPENRSRMNVTFGLPSTELEESFVREAGKQGLVGVKGHRSVGGMRASIYNALPLDAVEALAQFMVDFQRKHG